MLFKILISYILGYVQIKVEGYYIERFINSCNNKGIILWNIKRDKTTIVYPRVGISDFKRLRKIIKATRCKLEIINKKGLPFLLNKYRKRKLFAIALTMILFILIVTSNYIWNIEIVTEGNISYEEITDMLSDEGLRVGVLKGKIDTKRIINNIRLKREDIAWMGISLNGTNAVIEIIESKEKPNVISEDEYLILYPIKRG